MKNYNYQKRSKRNLGLLNINQTYVIDTHVPNDLGSMGVASALLNSAEELNLTILPRKPSGE